MVLQKQAYKNSTLYNSFSLGFFQKVPTYLLRKEVNRVIHSDKQKKISFTVLQNYCEVLEVGFVVEYVLGSTVNQDGTIYYGKSGFKISVGSLTHYKDRSEIIYPTLDEALQAGYKLAQRIERLGKNQHRAVSMR